MDDLEEAGLSAVVARADALMQRRRQPGPGNLPESEDLPLLTEIVEPDADLPVLDQEDKVALDFPTDLLSLDAAPPALDPAVLDILAHELTRHLKERLAAELPSLVESTLQSVLDGLTRELGHGLSEITQEAIQDFLAEREKLAKLQN